MGKDTAAKPKKNIAEGTNQYNLKKYVDDTLGSGNLRLAVKLPEGEDLNEWVAVNSEFVFKTTGMPLQRNACAPLTPFFPRRPTHTHTHCAAVDFFNQINMLYGTITEFCTPESCPVMSAGPK